jgi:hypothetical protein
MVACCTTKKKKTVQYCVRERRRLRRIGASDCVCVCVCVCGCSYLCSFIGNGMHDDPTQKDGLDTDNRAMLSLDPSHHQKSNHSTTHHTISSFFLSHSHTLSPSVLIHSELYARVYIVLLRVSFFNFVNLLVSTHQESTGGHQL